MENEWATTQTAIIEVYYKALVHDFPNYILHDFPDDWQEDIFDHCTIKEKGWEWVNSNQLFCGPAKTLQQAEVSIKNLFDKYKANGYIAKYKTTTDIKSVKIYGILNVYYSPNPEKKARIHFEKIKMPPTWECTDTHVLSDFEDEDETCNIDATNVAIFSGNLNTIQQAHQCIEAKFARLVEKEYLTLFEITEDEENDEDEE